MKTSMNNKSRAEGLLWYYLRFFIFALSLRPLRLTSGVMDLDREAAQMDEREQINDREAAAARWEEHVAQGIDCGL